MSVSAMTGAAHATTSLTIERSSLIGLTPAVRRTSLGVSSFIVDRSLLENFAHLCRQCGDRFKKV
jgi:hypothetical protein